MPDYIKGLNEAQKEAVLHINGPLMIIAGAGSGKTKVLTTRIAHLLTTGVDAFNILALTFTNKAAREMKERVERILGNNEARNPLYRHISQRLPEFYGLKPQNWAIHIILPFTHR
jgi:DNA helicase-2/ATP-dependent DNA helicase PcrA